MTVALQEKVSGEDDGDSYTGVGTGEAELYANNPPVTAAAAPNGETYHMVDVSRRARQALGRGAFEGFQSDRVMPRRLTFDRRAFGGFAVGPVELN